MKVPDELPSEVAVLTEIFAVSVGLDRAKQMSAFPNESFRFDDTWWCSAWSAGHVFFDESANVGSGNDHCGGFVGFSAEFCEAVGGGSCV